MYKKILAIICCIVLCLTLAACGTEFNSLKYTEIEFSNKPSDTIIAQNSNYTLELDKNNMGIVLVDNKTQEKWSSTPIDTSGPEVDEFGMPIRKHPRVESILSVECKDFMSNETNTYYSYTDAVKGGMVDYSTVDNGIVIKYFFSEANVMIPLKCELTDKGVRLSVDPTQIQENDNRVISIAIAPFFCGVKNDTENSYLFVPSGSGALVDTAAKSEQGNLYSAQVYGYDPTIDEVASTSTKETVRLNVYGAKMGNKAVCAIIDGSPASAWINVSSGSTTYGYSSVYASFQMRGYTNHVAELFSYESVENIVYSKKMINKPISVTFCPLADDMADYNGMAKAYREYLISEYDMQAQSEDLSLSVRVIGGVQKTESFVGIPYKTVHPATTIDEAQDIIEEINNNVANKFTVQLKGFGESGVNEGKIAGNYTVNKNLGSLGKLKNIFNYSKDNEIDLYFDFDIERYNKGSLGVSTFFDSVTNAGEQKATQYYYDIAVKSKKLETAYNILSPENFANVLTKVIKMTNKNNVSGISLDTLSSIAYSDYIDKENSKYYSKNGFHNLALNLINTAKTNNKNFMASSANIYSAVLADVITESPVTSDKSNIFVMDIPFYQMVFKGNIPLTVQSVNLAADSKLMILKAVETGSGLGYTVMNNWDSSMINSDLPYFYNSVYADIKDDIFKNSEELSDYYKKVSGMHIDKHTVYESGLRETVFENGVRVYVNYTEKTLDTPAGKLASYEYLITE